MTELTIIAEAGVNHNGDIERAGDMIRAAAEAGADLIKFQAFRAGDIASRNAPLAAYQKSNTGAEGQHELLRRLELTVGDFAELAAQCRSAKVGFLCTPFEAAMTRDLVYCGMSAIKVASGELTNQPALEVFADFGLPVYLSTGMATLREVEAAVATLRNGGAGQITLLHCTSLYPAPAHTINLRAITTMRSHFELPVGYSDHSLGDHVTVAAVALGASVIEKHFTLDRALPGPDHAASLEPDAFAVMVRRLRETEKALGDGIKRPAPEEEETSRLVRRSWHAARDLKAGTVLGEADVALKRPATGLPPSTSPVGRRLGADIGADHPIRAEALEADGAQ